MAEEATADKTVKGRMTKAADGGVEMEKRRWKNKYEFIFSCMSMSIGLGNFWRFPYVCYTHGGGAFLIPYVFVLIFIGRPMYYLDLCLGQFSNRGTIFLYHAVAPGWTGIGITQLICCFSVLTYYSYLLAIDMFYFIQSFTDELPWTKCLPSYGNNCISSNEIARNKTKDSTLEEGLGTPDWRLIICLLLTWLFAFGNMISGIKSSGKLAYCLALAPIIIMTVLLIRAATLPGAFTGILYLIKPQWHKLITADVWIAAITQCFFSLGIGYGTVANYASYNDIHMNISRIGLILAIVDSCCSLLAALTIFSGLGNLSHRLGIPVEKVVKGGMELAFVLYTDSISKFGFAPYLFALVFFVMFFTLGLGGLISYIQVTTTNMHELYPKFKEWHSALLVCAAGWLMGIVYTTQNGGAVLQLVDSYGNTYVLTVLALLQLVAVCYTRGLMYLCWDIEYMTQKICSPFWRWTWAIIAPIILFILYFYVFTDVTILKGLNPTYTIAGLCLLTVICIPIPISIVVYLIIYRAEGAKGTFKKTFSSENWLPFNEEESQSYLKYFNEKNENFKKKDEKPFKKFIYCLTHKQ